MKHKHVLRVVIPVLVILAAAGLWLMKDAQRTASAQLQQAVAGDNPAFVLEDTEFDLDSYLSHGLPVVLDFGAEECGPCQVMRPALEATHQKTLGKALIKFFDVWKRPQLSQDYPVMVVPTQVFLNADGTPYQPSEKVLGSGLQFEQYTHRDTGEHALTMHVGILNEDQFRLIFEDMGITYD